ncbi:MAG: DUF433 domain-containing protein [Pirellulales bacterium]|nr:DUF433 domain-containing protein [Pirellulales bacterium]
MISVCDIGQLISRDPNFREGKPCIAGTGIRVQRIVGWYKGGLSPEEIADDYEHLSLAQVYAALAYYHANTEEIENDIRAEEAEEERFIALHRQGKDSNR